MSKNIKDTDYLFLTANLRARESRMLTREKMERMIDASSLEEAAKLLEECGYEDMSKMSVPEVEAALAAHRTRAFDELTKLSPEPLIVDAFRLKYDYHNIKVLIKAEGVQTDGARILSGSGRIAPEALAAAYHAEEFTDLPPALAAAAIQARGTLMRTGNPQLADFIIDKAHYAELLEIAGRAGSSFLRDFAKTSIDSANLRACVRTLRMGRDTDFLRLALIPGGWIDAERFALAASSAGESLAALCVSSPLERAAALGAEALAGASMTEFELECDNSLTRALDRAKLISFGEGPVIAHISAIESEITAARMILTGRISGMEPYLIRERLRDSYV